MNFTLSDYLTIHIRVLLIIECNDHWVVLFHWRDIICCRYYGVWIHRTFRTQVEEYQPWRLSCVRLASFLFSQEGKKIYFGSPIVSRWQMYVLSVSHTELAVKMRYDWEEKFVRYQALGNSVSSYWSGSVWLEDSWSWMWKQHWLCGAISFVFFVFVFFFNIHHEAWRTHTHWPHHGNEICGLANDSKLSFQNHKVLDDSHLNCL